MSLFTINDNTLTLSIQSAEPMGLDTSNTKALLDQLREYKGILPILAGVHWVWNVAQDAYKYSWDTNDGRTWREWIKLLPGGGTSHRIDLQFWFTMPEFIPHRRLRDALLACVRDHGITSIDVTFK